MAQMLGALLWISYGLLIDAIPVIAANSLVFLAAAWTAWRVLKASGGESESLEVTDKSR